MDDIFKEFGKMAQRLVTDLLHHTKAWNACRRWYKWLSMIQLGIAYTMLASSAFMFVTAISLASTGACCTACGWAQGSTVWFNADGTYSHTEDRGECCRKLGFLLTFAGALCFIVSVILYVLSYTFLGLTFICLYEEVKEDAPFEIFFLKRDKENVPTVKKKYEKMDRKSKVLGLVGVETKIRGQYVYTHWVRTEHNEWVYTARRGATIYYRFDENNADGIAEYERAAAAEGITIVQDTKSDANQSFSRFSSHGSSKKVAPVVSDLEAADIEDIPEFGAVALAKPYSPSTPVVAQAYHATPENVVDY